ncbi:MAG: hypothetical protein RIB84_23935 [Sneathiellaceae bacterium]
MALYLAMRGGDVLYGPGPWARGAVRRALAAAGHAVSLGATAPAEALTLAAGPPAVRILVLPDRPQFDGELSTCTWDRQAGEWVVTHRAVAAMQTALVARSRALCRAGILAAASEEDQRNAALADGAEAATMLAMINGWREAHAVHKAAIEALDEQGDLAAYDLAAGWPGGA